MYLISFIKSTAVGNDDQRSPNRNINEVKEQYEYGYLRHIIDSRKDQDQSIT